MLMQTQIINGVKIVYPVGYSCVENYFKFLHNNLADRLYYPSRVKECEKYRAEIKHCMSAGLSLPENLIAPIAVKYLK